MFLTKSSDKLMFLRKQARDNGLTFKKVNHYWNGKQAYNLFDRKTGASLQCNSDTISGWYDNDINTGAIQIIASIHRFDKRISK